MSGSRAKQDLQESPEHPSLPRPCLSRAFLPDTPSKSAWTTNSQESRPTEKQPARRTTSGGGRSAPTVATLPLTTQTSPRAVRGWDRLQGKLLAVVAITLCVFLLETFVRSQHDFAGEPTAARGGVQEVWVVTGGHLLNCPQGH